MTGKRIFILIGVTVLTLGALFAVVLSQQSRNQMDQIFTTPAEPDDGRFRLPRAVDFPATADVPASDERAEGVDFVRSPRAEQYRSVLEEGFTVGPNFAGAYTVVTWGCGTLCQQSAIIDARTGEVLQTGILSSFGVAYATSSKLFAVNPRDRLDASPNAPQVASDYYIFEDNTLRHILKIDKEGVFQRACPPLEVVARNPLTEEERAFPSPCAVPVGWEEK